MPYATMTPYTPRQLRTMAHLVEHLTKTRRAAEAAGRPTTPDAVTIRFPSHHVGVAYWAKAELTSTSSEARNGGQAPWRYILDLGPNEPNLSELPRPLVVLTARDIETTTATGHYLTMNDQPKRDGNAWVYDPDAPIRLRCTCGYDSGWVDHSDVDLEQAQRDHPRTADKAKNDVVLNINVSPDPVATAQTVRTLLARLKQHPGTGGLRA